jgi:hypothetical protein
LQEHIVKKRKLEATKNNEATGRASTAQTSKSSISSQVRPVAKGPAQPAAAYDNRSSTAKLSSKLATTTEAKLVDRNVGNSVNQVKINPTAASSKRLPTGSISNHSIPSLQVIIHSIDTFNNSIFLTQLAHDIS